MTGRSHLQTKSIEAKIRQIFQEIDHTLIGLSVIDHIVLVNVFVDMFQWKGLEEHGKAILQ